MINDDDDDAADDNDTTLNRTFGWKGLHLASL